MEGVSGGVGVGWSGDGRLCYIMGHCVSPWALLWGPCGWSYGELRVYVSFTYFSYMHYITH